MYRRFRATGTYLYGDFRQFADVGGKLEPLTPPGARQATQDFAEAARLYAAREAAYRAAREAKARPAAAGAPAAPEPVRLGPFLAEHLAWKAGRPEVRTGTIVRDEKSARVLLRCVGNRPITEITAQVLSDYVEQRLAEPGVRRGTLTSPRSVRAELHTLSNAFRRAVEHGLVPKNPCSKLIAKPAIPDEEAVYLTDDEAARLLAAALEEDAATAELLAFRAADRGEVVGSGFDPLRRAAAEAGARRRAWADRPADAAREPSPDDQVPFAHAITATYLYTGGRASEVTGLLAEDVDFARERVRFRHSEWRRLKREYHVRSVRLWPALADVLRAHVAATGVSGRDLLFPSPATGGMLDRFGKPLDRCVRRAGIMGKRVTPKALRHTFATALLQTLVPTEGGGWAVRNSFDVAKQLGHKNSKLVDETYGHAVEDPVYRRELRYGAAPPPGAGAATDPPEAREDNGARGARGARTSRPAVAGRLAGPPPARPFTEAAILAARPDPLLHVVLQRRPDDCGTTALSMLLRVPYDVADAALRHVRGAQPDAGPALAPVGLAPGGPASEVPAADEGSTERQLTDAAARMGYRIRRHPAGTFDPRRCSAVLGIDFPAGRGHWVFVCGGTVYDCDGRVWAVGDYLAAHGAVASLALMCDAR